MSTLVLTPINQVKPTAKLHFNCLSCPQCSNLLVDSMPELEKNKEIKTVVCSNHCDFIGYRIGFRLLTSQEVFDLNLK